MNRVKKLPDENIIVVTNNVALGATVVEENRNAVRAIIKELDGAVSIIVDFRQAKTSLVDILEIMRGNRAGKRDDLNQRTKTIFVGTDKLIKMYRESASLPRFGGVQIPNFYDFDQALAAARSHLEMKAHAAANKEQDEQ